MNSQYMKPVILIVAALAANMLVTNVLQLLGISDKNASNMGFFAMIITAMIFYRKLRPSTKNRRNKK